jgi:anti-sigma factor RsiW
VQAYVDGEVDALSAAEIERHLQHCADCRALRAQIEELRVALKRDLPFEPAPPALRERIMLALDAEDRATETRRGPRSAAPTRRRSFWFGAASGFATAAASAAVAILVLALPVKNAVVDELLDAHLNSLMADHLLDVVSTDQHTVKPWFAGHSEVSPVVADFAPQGYKLSGGRVDYLEQQRAAVVVYQHGPHVINVFCWTAPPGRLPGNITRNGYHFAFWKSADLAYAAVSDTGWDELLGIERLLRGLANGAAPTASSTSQRE